MNLFQKRTAIRIAAVSLVLATVASPIAWYSERENAEKNIVSLALEETKRALIFRDATELTASQADIAAKSISRGLFHIAEIYDAKGRRLAESMTAEGVANESLLPHHVPPNYTATRYENLQLPDGAWALRVFVPLRSSGSHASKEIIGYFEGIRVVPKWQREQIFTNSMAAAVMVSLAALLCGIAIYPVVVRLAVDNEKRAFEVLDSHISIMESLGRAIAKRDSDTGAHNFRVAWIAASIGERMGITGNAMQSLIAGSFLHDVGKIGVPDAILLKPGRLDDDELVIMRTHVEQGEEIVSGIGWLDGANAVVAAHHEKWDGSGYPRRLKGEAIPLAARIFAVADVFDALCSKRPYKQPMGFEETMAILEKDTGSHFDEDVMTVFRSMAAGIFRRLENSTENDARLLLEESVRRHFEDGQ